MKNYRYVLVFLGLGGVLTIRPLLSGSFKHMLHGVLSQWHDYASVFSYPCSGLEVKKQKKLFGYDLGIEYHIHNDERYYKPSKRAILYLHPWGIFALPNKRHAHVMKYYDVLPGDVVSFNFPDGIWAGPFPGLRSSLGQLSDVLPALYTLAYAVKTYRLEAIDLFGYSRGAAVAVNMVAVLNDKSTCYDSVLEGIGITQDVRKQLVRTIEKGSLVLNCPLIDAKATIDMSPRWIQFIARRWSQYKDDGLQAIDAVKNLSDLKLNVLIHFQHNDTRVKNIKEADLYNAFAAINPKRTYLVCGNDGGHIHTQDALSQTLHVFYKQIGASYNIDKIKLYEKNHGEKGIIGVLLQPTIKESEALIAEFHDSCTSHK